jgi:hypothetical protein
MFVRKSSYDTVVAERDRLSAEVSRLKAELRNANGEVNSLKFRLNDVSIRLDHMVKAEAKKGVEERGVSFDIVSAKPQSKPVPPIGRTTRESGSTVAKPKNVSSYRRSRDEYSDDSVGGTDTNVFVSSFSTSSNSSNYDTGGCRADTSSSSQSDSGSGSSCGSSD